MRVHVTRGRMLVALFLIVLMPVLALWTVWIFIDPPFGGLPDNHVAATDSRVCPQTNGNNDPLADVTQHFGLVLPRGATQVVFSASVGGMQEEADLSLRFSTTPAGLAAFPLASKVPWPTATAQVSVGDWTTMSPGGRPTAAQGPCGLYPPTNQHMIYSQDGPDSFYGDSPRAVAVDMTAPAHPTVWVDAYDL